MGLAWGPRGLTSETRHYVESLLKAIGTRPGWDATRRAEILKLLLPPGAPN